MVKKILFILLIIGLFAWVAWYFFGNASMGGAVRFTTQGPNDAPTGSVDARATVVVGSPDDIRTWLGASRLPEGYTDDPGVRILTDESKPNAVEVVESELGSWRVSISQSENTACIVEPLVYTDGSEINHTFYRILDCVSARAWALNIPADITLIDFGRSSIRCTAEWQCSPFNPSNR